MTYCWEGGVKILRHFTVDKIGDGGTMRVQIGIDQSKSKRSLPEVVRNSR